MFKNIFALLKVHYLNTPLKNATNFRVNFAIFDQFQLTDAYRIRFYNTPSKKQCLHKYHSSIRFLFIYK